MNHRFFDGGCIDPAGGGGGGSEAIHVAQQSRRDKLRVQTHQLDHDANLNPNANPNHHHHHHHDFIYATSGILDFSANDPNSFLSPASCDWIINNPSMSMSMSMSSYGDNNLPFSLPTSYDHNTLQQVVDPSSSSTPPPPMGNKLMTTGLSLPPWATDDTTTARHEFALPKDDNKGFQYLPTNHYQGLSLSLASNPPTPQLRIDTVDNIGSSTVDPRKVSAGPLGPFTGYATILKISKFLKPAQQLLDEFCSVVTGCSGGGASGSNVSSAGFMGDEGIPRGNSSLSTYNYSSTTTSSHGSGVVAGVNCNQGRRPEMHHKKVKLLYLQDEVCRRYKQYHQQMQMVVSSFESVAGLSGATPYTSLAVRSASKHFRCLKNAISDQLRQVSKLLGEELMSSPSSSSRGETMMTTPRLKHVDHGLKKHNRGNENSSLGFVESNQPVWRPQRGLPERAVAVLRAWLFEHFLHPYPTDTDKHMLATQTGLTRSQVSNWFINARVRLWKPMVEEIHSLESKGMSEMDLNSSNKNDGKSAMNGDMGRHPYRDPFSEAQSNKSLDYSSMGGPIMAKESNVPINLDQWHREKRTRMEECEIPPSIDDGLMSFAYHQGGGMDHGGGGLGAVSLTLGLRHSEDPHQQQQMRHFGSQMLHDFVG